MLNYEEFKKEIERSFLSHMPAGYQHVTIEIIPNLKVNGNLDSLRLVIPESNIHPSIPLDQFYAFYESTCDIEKTLERFAKAMEQALESKENLDMVKTVTSDFDPEIVKANVIFQLINTKMNKELLASVPHRDFLDLSIIYRWIVEDNKDGTASTILINNPLIEKMGITEEELFKLAKTNTPRLMPSKICSMKDTLLSLGLEEEADECAGDLPEMYTIFNEQKLFGASAILYRKNLESLAEKTNSDLYLLPSSVHEFLALPVKGDEDVRGMMCMIKDINNTELQRCDILSYSLYRYDRKQKKIHIVDPS